MQTAERVSYIDPSDNVIYQRHLFAYQQAVPYIQGSVLEVGCGEGYGIGLLSPKADSYIAIDKFETNQKNVDRFENVEFKQMNIPPIDFPDETFDTIISFQVIEHIEEDQEFVQEIHRVLKRNGTFICTTPNKPMSLTRNPWHVREYTATELGGLLSTYFDQVELNGVSGNEKVMKYYQENKKSVQKITRWDFLNLQYRLPRRWLQLPYDFFNRLNRKKLLKENSNLTDGISANDHQLVRETSQAFDFFCKAIKK